MNAVGWDGCRVHAYRNLTCGRRGGRAVWSVRAGGRVVAHVGRLALADATFHVQASGRARAQTSGHRNVHAYVAGTVVAQLPSGPWAPVGYDPFGPATFTDTHARAVTAASWVRLGPDGCHVIR